MIKQNGFTIIELLIVIAIIGILTAIDIQVLTKDDISDQADGHMILKQEKSSIERL